MLCVIDYLFLSYLAGLTIFCLFLSSTQTGGPQCPHMDWVFKLVYREICKPFMKDTVINNKNSTACRRLKRPEQVFTSKKQEPA